MTLLSSTITNCAAASTAMGSQVGDDRASGCAAAAGRGAVMAAGGSRADARGPRAAPGLALHVDAALGLVGGGAAAGPRRPRGRGRGGPGGGGPGRRGARG